MRAVSLHVCSANAETQVFSEPETCPFKHRMATVALMIISGPDTDPVGRPAAESCLRLADAGGRRRPRIADGIR